MLQLTFSNICAIILKLKHKNGSILELNFYPISYFKIFVHYKIVLIVYETCIWIKNSIISIVSCK